jgi:hypothetical protein
MTGFDIFSLLIAWVSPQVIIQLSLTFQVIPFQTIGQPIAVHGIPQFGEG